MTLNIERMMCEMCVAKVQDALTAPGISNLSVKIGKATLVYDPDTITEEQILSKVIDAGFPAKIKKGLF
ncbi:MAG: cation transporter [archaeon]|nr:cation transporter [archaeon]